MRALALLVVVFGCGARTELGTLGAAPAACTLTCDAGEVCIHAYYTHDPPPPLPDGGVCSYGTQRYDRCWSVIDRCEAVPPGCADEPSCSCPSFASPTWPEGCECQGDGTFDCYSIGI